MFHHTAIVKSRPTPDAAQYDPLAHQRRCARCGRRDAWRQLRQLGGGWLCCPSRELLDVWRDEAHHQCSQLCRLGGVA